MADEPKPDQTSNFPLDREKVDQHIADARELADDAYEAAGWNKLKPKRLRSPKPKTPSKA